MSKGLKQMVSEALADETETVRPVEVSGEAQQALAERLRQWTGWADAALQFAPARSGSPASCDHLTHTITVDIERVLRNPHRVLLSVTPFRLRQEALLTGVLLHEAGHARHSLWQPRTEEARLALRHGDGSEVTDQTLSFARLLEEPRIEARMAAAAAARGAGGLEWTLRASAAHFLPVTSLAVDPDQRIMDVISGWVLRAGRHAAKSSTSMLNTPQWVRSYIDLMIAAIRSHLLGLGYDDALADDISYDLYVRLHKAVNISDDKGSSLIDAARDILSILYPQGSSATPSTECQSDDTEGEAGEGEGEAGEGEAGESDEGDESDEAGESESEGDDWWDEAGEGESEDAGSGDLSDEEQAREIESRIRAIEKVADRETEEETAQAAQTAAGGMAGSEGSGEDDTLPQGWRAPTKDEREIQRGAEKFLRDLLSPSESSTESLTDTPSSTVDGAALSAWKAGGQINAPHFFRRTRRNVEPSPPVRVAILVDVSGSMDELQKPSAVLSWALSSAALDMQNFAGRGAQVESCLIHWGSTARVVQRNGENLPGIREVRCVEGTYAMAEALSLVDEQMPGFFDVTETPVNRLLVQFTDWEFGARTASEAAQWLSRSSKAGVNMVTVAPRDYSERRSALEMTMEAARRISPVQRGSNTLLRYDRSNPSSVWQAAAEALG